MTVLVPHLPGQAHTPQRIDNRDAALLSDAVAMEGMPSAPVLNNSTLITATSINATLINATLINATPDPSPVIAQADEPQTEADRLFRQGITQYGQSQFRQAIDSWQQALVLYREMGDRAGEGRALGNLGIVHTSLGQYERAIDFLEQVLAIAQETDDLAGQGRALNALGVAYANLSQYEPAIDFFSQHLAIARDLADLAEEGSALNNLGILHRELGQYDQAITLYEQALALLRDIGDRAGEGSTLNNLGNVYGDLGQIERAIDVYEQSLAIDRTINNRSGESSSLNNLGTAYNTLGQYQRAIDLYEQALAIARDIGDPAQEGDVLSNLGTVYSTLGQYQRAIDVYGQALASARNVGDRVGEGNVLGNLGIVYRNLGQYERAIDFYEQSLAIDRAIGNRAGESSTLGNLGIVHRSLGQYERAIDFYEQALAIAQDIGDRPGEGSILGNLGIGYSDLDQHDQAIAFYGQALAIAQDIGDRDGEGSALNNLGATLLDTKQFVDAERVLRQSIATLESLRADLTDAQRIAISDTQAQAYANLEIALIAQDKIAEALIITERGRAQAFALQLALRQGDTPEAPYPTLTDIQRIAQERNITLVSYSLIFNQALYIWVVSPAGDIQFRAVDFDSADTTINPIATIDGPVVRSDRSSSDINQLVANTRAGIGVVGGLPPQRLQALHQVLIAPIADLLPTDPNDNVVFIPQGSLFLVPFAALKDEDGTYLTEKHTITTAPSIQVLGLAAESVTPSQPFNNSLVVGNPEMPSLPNLSLAPLPGAEAEAVAIGALLNQSPLLGAQATEAQVKAQMPTAQLIHLATHGLLDYSSSRFEIPGALALTPGSGEDGLLTTSEILDMDLQAQLAILSACDTGRGEITGDGVVGLSRALITAGVPSVVVSLWAVPDSPTAMLMTEFYRQLGQGQTKAQALRQAMLITMAQHPEPRNWAAFTLIGANE